MGFAHASTLRDASTTRDRSCQYALRAWRNLETCQLREDHSGQFHYRAKRGAQYRSDSTIDAPYRFAMPVRPEIGRASTPCGRGRDSGKHASSASCRRAGAASQESSPTPALRATPPKRGIRHITELCSVHSIDRIARSMHSMGFAHASTTQDQGGASTITERSCPYATRAVAWKRRRKTMPAPRRPLGPVPLPR